MSTPFDVDGLWQIRLTITSPRLSRFQTQGYIDAETKDKILEALSETTPQTSDKTIESQELTPDYLEKCPNCNGPADNGFDRSWPDPNPYFCTKCMKAMEY